MTKTFCDICGAPAAPPLTCEAFGYLDQLNREKGVFGELVASVTFSFRNRQKGLSDTPDLCTACAEELLKKLPTNHERHEDLMRAHYLNEGATLIIECATHRVGIAATEKNEEGLAAVFRAINMRKENV